MLHQTKHRPGVKKLIFVLLKIFFTRENFAGRSSVGPIRRPGDRKIDTSPYSSGNVAYLSPPSDSSWRRTSSDSAIHQSLTQTQVNFIKSENYK